MGFNLAFKGLMKISGMQVNCASCSIPNVVLFCYIFTHITSFTGCFIMFSMITNIYNRKTKGPTLMELFTATGKLKKFFFGNWRCSMCAPLVTRHTSIRYSSSCHMCVNMGAMIFLTAAMIRAFRSARSRGDGGMNTLHEMHVAQ